MKTALLMAPQKVEIHETAQPRVGPGEVLIQPSHVGICGSDVSFYQGHRVVPYPFLLGHEMVGRIVAVGEGVVNFQIGQRVIVERVEGATLIVQSAEASECERAD